MLETLNLEKRMTKEAYRRVLPGLQERLRRLQYDLQKAEISTVVVFEGVDGAGKGTVISRLVERLDPRLCRVVPASPPSEEERARHFLWRYQMKLPADGAMTIFDRSWYGRLLVERIDGDLSDDLTRQACLQIRDFERWLADDGQVLVKFYLHISKKTQRKRLKQLEKDALQSWKVTKEDWRHHKEYDEWVRAAELMITATDSHQAPWTPVASTDRRSCRVHVFQTLIRRMEEALERRLVNPRAVSRTAAAGVLARAARQKASAELSRLAKELAAAAGLPLEEAPEPLHRRRKARARRKGRRGARKAAAGARR